MPNRTDKCQRKIAILQSCYLPWKGYFDIIGSVDVFVVYDDVQFDLHGWRNRNRVKSPNGPHWLTVPVRHTGLGKRMIHEIEIDNRLPWGRKHLGTIRQFYAKAPFVDRYLPELAGILSRGWERLVALDLALTELMCSWLHLQRRVVLSSQLGIQGERSERLLHLCLHFGATRYLSGDAAKEYLDVQLFAERGITVAWQEYDHPVYPQLHGEFVSHLSALDLVLNCGGESDRILAGQETREKK